MNIQIDSIGEILAAGAVILAAIALVALVVGKFLRRGGRIKGAGLELGVKDEQGQACTTHAECPRAAELASLIDRTAEITEKRLSLLFDFKFAKRFDLIAEQMRFFDDVFTGLESVMSSCFISGLAKKLGRRDGIVDQGAYKSYMLIIARLREAAAVYVRSAMRENGLAEINGQDWYAYKERKRVALQAMATKTFNELWYSEDLTREELYRLHLDGAMDKRLAEAVDRVFEFAREQAQALQEDHAAKMAAFEQERERYQRFLRTRFTGEERGEE